MKLTKYDFFKRQNFKIKIIKLWVYKSYFELIIILRRNKF